jgi:hypothetical protein
MLFGLGGTQELSLPMLTVLRRFSILMTMIGEFYILKVVADFKVQMSVYMMIFGAIVAAANDLAFNLKVRGQFFQHEFAPRGELWPIGQMLTLCSPIAVLQYKTLVLC